MAESNYQQMSEQHINHLNQTANPPPTTLIQQAQASTPGLVPLLPLRDLVVGSQFLQIPPAIRPLF